MEPARGLTAARAQAQGARNGSLRPVGFEREALLRVAAAAAGAHDLEQVLEVAAEEARAAICAASLSVSRWDRDGATLRTIINVGALGPGEERYPAAELYPLGEDLSGQRLLTEGVPYFNAVDDPEVDPWCAARLRRLGKESEVGVPILVEGEPWGEVYATTAPGEPRFRGEDVRFLEAVAGQLAVAIERAELFSRVSRLAYEDPLTGLANRRALEERLDRAVTRAAERGSGLALLLCDVDELKAINDEHGHDGGDRALRHVAEALVAAAATRAGNLVGRLSGDEFCVVMEGATLEHARDLAAAALAALGPRLGMHLSISCGAASLDGAVTTPVQLLRAADAALYRAKRNGGGQIFTAGSHGAERTGRGERRSLRRSTRDRVRDAMQEVAERFEGPLAGEGPLERIEAVAVHLSEAVNGAAWAVSLAPAGGDSIHTVSQADTRDQRLEGMRLEVDNDIYAVDDYPATARLIRAGAGAFVAHVDDTGADPAERALLVQQGRRSVLAAAAADHDFPWLLELYADERSAPLEEAQYECSLLVRAAIPPRPAGKGGSALLQRRTRQVQLTSGLAARLAGAGGVEAIVAATMEEVHSGMAADASAIVRLADDQAHELVAGAGPLGDPSVRRYSPPAPGRGLISRCLRENGAVLVPDVRREPDYFATPVTAATRSELDVPVVLNGRAWGAISVQSNEPEAFDEEDVRLLSAVADQLAAALRSASLYEQLERAYLGTAEALSAALEAKDSYTAAHSRSLVERAEAVGRRLGVPGADLRSLRYAAVFHDIGKLAVPEAILNKPGPLTEEEFALVQRHTVVGEQILAPVEFLADVLPLVRGAHERWDGGGYPDGLAGEEIPLGARIVFACDTYEAMTTDRPYRAALPDEEARAELRRAAGTQLDPRVVEALLDVVG